MEPKWSQKRAGNDAKIGSKVVEIHRNRSLLGPGLRKGVRRFIENSHENFLVAYPQNGLWKLFERFSSPGLMPTTVILSLVFKRAQPVLGGRKKAARADTSGVARYS